MFQSFTGSSRRPRQVNLSGRNANPFTPFPSGRHGPQGHGSQNTLAVAQQERILRQQERDRLSAARLIQRTWRGHRSRKITGSLWRAEWDVIEQRRARDLQLIDFTRYENMRTEPTVRYTTAAQCLSQLRLLLHFLEIGNKDDAQRLIYFLEACQRTLEEIPTITTENEWRTLLVKLAKTTLRVLHTTATPSASISGADRLLCLVGFLIGLAPKQMARMAEIYYTVMATLTQNLKSLSKHTDLSAPNLVDAVLALLKPITSETLCAYEWFARIYLTIPDLESHLGTLVSLAAGINYKLLASSLDECIDQYSGKVLSEQDTDSRLWLLAYFIYFHRHALSGTASQQAPEPKFVRVVSQILNSMASCVSRRLETDDFTENEGNQSTPLPPFVREQMFSLVNQTSITGLLSRVRSTHFSQATGFDASNDARILATYALTLLRVFPRRGDEIRMWLYLGSTSSDNQNSSHQPSRMPAIKYFWQASRSTSIFIKISQDSNEVLPLLKLVSSNDSPRAVLSEKSLREREQEWTIILLFLELYTFVLKVMDDEEFFSGGLSFLVSNTRVSWTKESALPLRDVKDMTVFLKNLAFTLYWNAADLNDAGMPQDPGGIRNYFSLSFPPLGPMASIKDLELKSKDKGLSGVIGIPLDYFKGLVTGLLRMIHERE
jgi:ubiquitin-protein ligase E3 C